MWVAPHLQLDLAGQKCGLNSRYREQTSGYQWAGGGAGKGNIRGGEGEVQTIGCEIGYKDVLYNTGKRANIL